MLAKLRGSLEFFTAQRAHEADVEAGKVKVIAPEGFLEHAISENVIAGNAMSRRAIYMYGSLLPRNAQDLSSAKCVH